MKVIAKQKNGCKTCYGYGLWAIGDPVPMGPMDAADGCLSKKCPECGKGGNPGKSSVM